MRTTTTDQLSHRYFLAGGVMVEAVSSLVSSVAVTFII